MSELQDAAVALTARFKVLPLHDGDKEPRLKRWGDIASDDPDLVRGWWSRWQNANVGILCGDGLAVLDVDPRHDGDKSLAELEAQHGPLPPTLEVLTGGGGRHLYFVAPIGTPSWKHRRPGLELKSEGTQVVAPPSRHESGGIYRWKVDPTTPLAAIPEWVLSLNGSNGSAPIVEGPIPEGLRHDTLMRNACAMRRREMGEAAILAALRQENQDRCDPPLPDEEVAELARDIAKRYAPALRTSAIADTGAATLEDLMAAFRAYLAIENADHVLFSLAVAIAADFDGDPLWGLLVGAPSSGKTETLRALDEVADEHLDEITAAGLLSWRPAKAGTPRHGPARAKTGTSVRHRRGPLNAARHERPRHARHAVRALAARL